MCQLQVEVAGIDPCGQVPPGLLRQNLTNSLLKFPMPTIHQLRTTQGRREFSREERVMFQRIPADQANVVSQQLCALFPNGSPSCIVEPRLIQTLAKAVLCTQFPLELFVKAKSFRVPAHDVNIWPAVQCPKYQWTWF